MAIIKLISGGTFSGDIFDYDWKGKFLVAITGPDDVKSKKIIHWNNVESVSVYDEDAETEPFKKQSK